MTHYHYSHDATADESFFEEALASDSDGTEALSALPALAAQRCCSPRRRAPPPSPPGPGRQVDGVEEEREQLYA